MTTRVAFVVSAGLILAIAVGGLTTPRHTTAYSGPAVINYPQAQGFSMPSGAAGTPLGIVAGLLVAGAAVIGTVFFAPRERRLRDIPSAARQVPERLVGRHPEIGIFLEYLQTVDEQILTHRQCIPVGLYCISQYTSELVQSSK
ncbi:hypothetical protein D5S18_24700 [Nocardia panacis]|uniref:Uncharacterized protein n=1 Tax=Nocardia panacis TaxID=2340916 RepID=A0A3A4K320_9NOCA|nr:hypothetical protein [Nocardia panacis]RJO72344.1 hypothetical protein D5S18_24700 [Nocardia panacis]